jgi:hypothetical protein
MARTELRNNPKFKRLVRALGLPIAHTVGLLELMWHSCYESGNEVIGDADDVELAAEWTGEPGKLFKSLLDPGAGRGAGFIEAVPNTPLYRVHDLRDHAPNYVQKKLDRRKNKELQAKTADIDCKTAVDDPMTSNRHNTDTTQTHLSAAGAATARARKPRKEPTGDHAKIIKHFCDSWKSKYGTKYPFLDGRDGKHVKWIREKLNDELQAVLETINRFFESEDQFITKDRHSLGMLVSQFRKFITPEAHTSSLAAPVYPTADEVDEVFGGKP